MNIVEVPIQVKGDGLRLAADSTLAQGSDRGGNARTLQGCAEDKLGVEGVEAQHEGDRGSHRRPAPDLEERSPLLRRRAIGQVAQEERKGGVMGYKFRVLSFPILNSEF